MNNYDILGNILVIGNKQINFRTKIEKVIRTEGKYIVLLYNDLKSNVINDVYAVDDNGQALWQMQDPKENFPIMHHSIVTAIHVDKENRILAGTYFGNVFYLNPLNGIITKLGSTK